MKVLRVLWKAVDFCRRLVLNACFFAVLLLAAVMYFWMPAETPTVEPRSILSIDLTGRIVESGSDRGFLADWQPAALRVPTRNTTRLSDVLSALARAQSDPDIAAVVFNLDGMSGIGLASARTIGAAIDNFKKATGRRVYAFGSSFTQGQYALAAHADEVSMNPMGQVLLKGLSGNSLYWGALLRWAGIEVNVYKAGAFKSAPELYVLEAPSAENLEAQKSYLDAAWSAFAADIERARGMMPGAVARYIESLPQQAEDGGDLAEIARKAGFVNRLESEQTFRERLASAYADGGRLDRLKNISMQDYLAARAAPVPSRPRVAVVTAEGVISSSASQAGISADELCERIETAAEDPLTKAIVLRVNSPGGDALSAELIRERLEWVRREKKIPVVASMGDAAASGGYWISTAADKIVADPFTLTGSIGVFAIVPTFEGTLSLAHVGQGGWRTTPLADWGNPFHKPASAEAALYNAGVRSTYARFKQYVAQSRKMTLDAVEEVGQGRVWLGKQALEKHLVDRLGGLDDAVKLAADLAGLPAEPPVKTFDPQENPLQMLLAELSDGAASRVFSAHAPLAAASMLKLPREADDALALLCSTTGAPLVWSPILPEL